MDKVKEFDAKRMTPESTPNWERSFVAGAMLDEATAIGRYQVDPNSLKHVDFSGLDVPKISDSQAAKILSKIRILDDNLAPPNTDVNKDSLTPSTLYNLGRLSLAKVVALEESGPDYMQKEGLRNFGRRIIDEVSMLLTRDSAALKRALIKTTPIVALVTACTTTSLLSRGSEQLGNQPVVAGNFGVASETIASDSSPLESLPIDSSQFLQDQPSNVSEVIDLTGSQFPNFDNLESARSFVESESGNAKWIPGDPTKEIDVFWAGGGK